MSAANARAFLILCPLAAFAIGCFNKLDVSKVPCKDDVHCPTDYRCVIVGGNETGTCTPKIAVVDGSATSADVQLPLDAVMWFDGVNAVDGSSRVDGDLPRDAILDLVQPDQGSDDQPIERDPNSPPETTFPPDAPVADAPLKQPGTACTTAAECQSNVCADGVCCDKPCTGQCEACAESANPGKCTTITGTPRKGRPACAANQAKCAGQCGGTAADHCAYPGSETVCTSASCTSDSALTTASVCDQMGGCTTAQQLICETGKVCNAGVCVAPGANGSFCQSNSQCVSGNCSTGMCCAVGLTHCNGACTTLSTSANCGTCGHACPSGSVCSGSTCLLSLGQACASGPQCEHGFCVDGVCCNRVCSGQCEACGETSSPGTCVTVSGSPRSPRAACSATQPSCAGQCNGSLASQCSYPGNGTVCSAATCNSETQLKNATVCNGSGACTSISTTTCLAGTYCSAGACISKVENGGSCSSNTQCTSGNCSNATCCAGGYANCGSGCVSLSTNQNCGYCGNACGINTTCSGGSCLLVDGQACTSSGQCVTGSCTTFYYDGDRDGYGTPNVYSRYCGTTPPANYSSNNKDCCDTDNLAHPGAAGSSLADACGKFDWDCDGSDTPTYDPPLNCGTATCGVDITGHCVYSGGCTCAGSGMDACRITGTAVNCGAQYDITAFACDFFGPACVAHGFTTGYNQQVCH